MSNEQSVGEPRTIEVSVDKLILIAGAAGKSIASYYDDDRGWTLFAMPDGSGIVVRAWRSSLRPESPAWVQDADQLTPEELIKRRAELARMDR